MHNVQNTNELFLVDHENASVCLQVHTFTLLHSLPTSLLRSGHDREMESAAQHLETANGDITFVAKPKADDVEHNARAREGKWAGEAEYPDSDLLPPSIRCDSQ